MKNKNTGLWIGVILLLLVIGGMVWYIRNKTSIEETKKDLTPPQPTNTTVTNNTVSPKPPTVTTPVTTTTPTGAKLYAKIDTTVSEYGNPSKYYKVKKWEYLGTLQMYASGFAIFKPDNFLLDKGVVTATETITG